MISLYDEAVITQKGIEATNKQVSENADIQFTRFIIGNGEYTEQEKAVSALEAATDLKGRKNAYAISSQRIASDGRSVELKFTITNVDAEGQAIVAEDYYANEIGLFARLDEGSGYGDEFLFSIAVCARETGDAIPAYTGNNPIQIVQGYAAVTANAQNVSVSLRGAYALADDLEEAVGELEDGISAASQAAHKELEDAVATAQAVQDFYGGKNLIDLKTTYSYTTNGVTRVVDANKGTITLNGTSENSGEVLIGVIKVKPNTSYTLSGGPAESTPSSYALKCYEYNTSDSTSIASHFDVNGRGSTFTTKENAVRIDVYYAYASGSTFFNSVWKPMLRLTEGTSDEFEPFSPSNKWLANRLPNIPSHVRVGMDLTPRLGTTLYKEISKGDFNNIRPGDYIIGPSTGLTYYIAHRDLFLNKQNVISTIHHLIIIPKESPVSTSMNATATTKGGYYNSLGFTKVEDFAQNYFIKDFGEHILKHNEYLSNAVSNYKASGNSTYQVNAALMTEANVFGFNIFADINRHDVGAVAEQFEIFRDLGHHIITESMWFRDIANDSNFVVYRSTGYVDEANASNSFAFYPYAVLR